MDRLGLVCLAGLARRQRQQVQLILETQFVPVALSDLVAPLTLAVLGSLWHLFGPLLQLDPAAQEVRLVLLDRQALPAPAAPLVLADLALQTHRSWLGSAMVQPVDLWR